MIVHDTSARILLYCTKNPSARSLLSSQTLRSMGYDNVEVLGGGLVAWTEAGLPYGSPTGDPTQSRACAALPLVAQGGAFAGARAGCSCWSIAEVTFGRAKHIGTRPPRYGALMSTSDWDERYTSHHDGLWSGRANGVLVAEVAQSSPGHAVDIGCGEGADAIWLARAGWHVTGVDVSQVALDRAASAAREANVTVQWVHCDVSAMLPAFGGYDLVSVLYPALKHSPGDEAIRALLDNVAPGGTLLVVGHAPLDPDHARAHGFELADYVQPADVRVRLDEGWEIEVDETRPRVDPPPEGSPHTHDVVLRAKRRL